MGLRRRASEAGFPRKVSPIVRRKIRCCFVLLLKFASIVCCAVGLAKMRAAFSASSMSVNASNIMPWAIASVLILALVISVPDIIVADSIIHNRAPRCCGESFTAILHPVLWLIVLIYGTAVFCLAVGYGIKGLSQNAGLAGDIELVFGLTGNDIEGMLDYVDDYIVGAILFVVGSFLAIPAQGWLLACSLENMSAVRAAETPYTPRRRYESYELDSSTSSASSADRGTANKDEGERTALLTSARSPTPLPFDASAAQSRKRLEMAGLLSK